MLVADGKRFMWANVLVRLSAALYSFFFIILNYVVFRFCFPLLIYTLPCLLGSTLVLWSLLPRREPARDLCRADSTSLGAVLQDICLRAKVPAIERVEVFFAANASAYSVKGISCVGIGFPLLLTLSRPETEAILAHEIAHHLYGDAGKERIAARLDQQLERIVQLFSRRVSALILLPFKPVFLRLLRYVRRAHRDCEFHADEFAAAVIGANSLASALCRLDEVSTKWQVFLVHWVSLLREAPVGIDLISMYDAYLVSCQGACPKRPISTRLSGAYDTHPSLEERLERLGVSEDTGCQVMPERHVVVNRDEISSNFFRVFFGARLDAFVTFERGYLLLAKRLIQKYQTALALLTWRDLDNMPKAFSRFSFASFQFTGVDHYETERRMFIFLIGYLVYSRSRQPLRVGEFMTPFLRIDDEEVDLWAIVTFQFSERSQRLRQIVETFGIDMDESLA